MYLKISRAYVTKENDCGWNKSHRRLTKRKRLRNKKMLNKGAFEKNNFSWTISAKKKKVLIKIIFDQIKFQRF